jgi:hypothetical protein
VSWQGLQSGLVMEADDERTAQMNGRWMQDGSTQIDCRAVPPGYFQISHLPRQMVIIWTNKITSVKSCRTLRRLQPYKKSCWVVITMEATEAIHNSIEKQSGAELKNVWMNLLSMPGVLTAVSLPIKVITFRWLRQTTEGKLMAPSTKICIVLTTLGYR